MSATDVMAERVALAKSILGHADQHEARAVDEALLALQGATIAEIAALRAAREDR